MQQCEERSVSHDKSGARAAPAHSCCEHNVLLEMRTTQRGSDFASFCICVALTGVRDGQQNKELEKEKNGYVCKIGFHILPSFNNSDRGNRLFP